MDKIISPKNMQINEALYRTINYPNINTIPINSIQNTSNITKNQKTSCCFHLSAHPPSINNKKNYFLDEDNTKNNENFKIFMDNLLSKDEASTILENKNIFNNDKSCIHSNRKFFLKKLNKKMNKYNINNNKIKKEEDIYYSFQDNKIKNQSSPKINNDFFHIQYKLKNFLSSVPKKSRKNIIYNKDYKNISNNINIINDLDINNKVLDSTNNILQSFNTEKKNIGINCKISDYFLKSKKRNINDNMRQLAQTFSFKEFDGRMLNKIGEIDKIGKKTKKYKNKNHSFNHIKKGIPPSIIPKIIYFSRNNTKRDKEAEHKLNTMKENVFHFLKDKSQNNIISKNCYNNTNYNEKTELNYNNQNKYLSKKFNNPIEKYRLIYSKEGKGKGNIMPFLKLFEKNYKKKIKKNKMKMKNKNILYSSLKNINYNNNKCLTINNIK